MTDPFTAARKAMPPLPGLQKLGNDQRSWFDPETGDTIWMEPSAEYPGSIGVRTHRDGTETPIYPTKPKRGRKKAAPLMLPPPDELDWSDFVAPPLGDTDWISKQAIDEERAKLRAEVVAAAERLRDFDGKNPQGDPSAPVPPVYPTTPTNLPAEFTGDAQWKHQIDHQRAKNREMIEQEQDEAADEAARLAQKWLDDPERVYPTSPTNGRSTKAQVKARRDALRAIVFAQRPMTVRQVFYQATVKGFVAKTEDGYRQVAEDLAVMRREGELPYHWLVDSTRIMRKPRTFRDPREAAAETARLYRKSLWAYADDYVEIWLEKDALAGVITEVTSEYDVPLMVARGFASLSFLYSAAETIRELNRPTFIYHLGDFDPSGVAAGKSIETSLREMASGEDITFVRIAVTPQQIRDWRLPSRPTKQTDSRAKNFGSRLSVELDAIHPRDLRQLVRDAIELHLPEAELEVLKQAEASERQLFEAWATALQVPN